MPPDYDAEKSEYAGQDRVYKNRQIIKTISGGKVIIMDYLKDEGLYVVTNIDGPDTASPAYKIDPDKLVQIEDGIEE